MDTSSEQHSVAGQDYTPPTSADDAGHLQWLTLVATGLLVAAITALGLQ